jgi:twitching motility protein PilT
MTLTPGMRNLIRRGKIEQLRSQMSLERTTGAIDLDQSLSGLVRNGWVEYEEARARARAPEDFDKWLGGPGGGERRR